MNPIKMTVEGVEFYKINTDKNGNPRYVFHWMSLADTYADALALAKHLGAQVYRGKWYGGGLVFTSYNINADARNIRCLNKHFKMLQENLKSA